ncbi:DUF973 family protein [Pseudoflavitalea sp. X16]|uniref:DUF973 family protein n=1 Tax=Paraflavitalea devenefica TaxID=2716334 RepID=UPI0014203AA1|nr:DUF973 family protein [Paraflavitalea devenefica]NII25341.1 DUF973 family protein [Paraflavitalea devenefica]
MRKVLVTFFTCLSLMAAGQVTFQFVPELQGRTADGLLWVKLNSQYQQPIISLVEISVSEKKAGKIISVTTGSFLLLPGANAISRNAASSAIIRFANNNLARLVKQSSSFPEGEYEYCFQLYRADKSGIRELLGEQCFDYLVEPLTPLFLIEPFLKEQTCDKRPTFTWQPSMPAIPGARYRLTLAEMKPGQAIQEALVYNLPLINQSNITSPILIYPAAAKSLEEGKSYSWQVTVYREGVILNRSETWEFTVKCNDTPVVEKTEGFRDIDDLAKGNFYIANGKLHFSLHNAYEKQTLKYSIFCLNKPDQVFKRLPAIKLQQGNNNITIDLAENSAFVDGFHYILTVHLVNGTTKKMRFTYKTPL